MNKSMKMPLHDAVIRNDEADITALIEACIRGNKSIVLLLLENGCPAQPTAGFRHSPLRGAAVCGHAHLIPLLLKFGSCPNSVSDGHRTPLMGACFLRNGIDARKSVECVRALLDDERTDPTIANSYSETALDLAKIRGYTESILLLQQASDRWKK